MDKYVIFHVEGGLGKSVLATAVCQSIKKAYPEHKLIVVSPWAEPFLHNPFVYRVYKMGNFAYFYEDFVKDKDTVILRSEPYHSEDFIYNRKHLVQIWCDLFKIPCVTLKPELFLTQRELINASKVLNKQNRILLIHPFGGADGQEHGYSWARDLSPAFAQNLVNSVFQKFEKVLHVRRDNQQGLQNTIQVTDNLRNLFCYVYFADKIVAVDSVIQHVAAALNKPAAVGWILNSPTVFGHSIHKNIFPSQQKSFRHGIDSYLEEADWVGRRLYECPYDNVDNIFSMDPFLEYINEDVLKFDKMP